MKTSRIDWQIAGAFVGTIVGAGFASGQELMQFFVKFGIMGIYGVILAGLLFIFLAGVTVYLVKINGYRTYHDLLSSLIGGKLGAFTDRTIVAFLFLGLSVMLSGCGALFKEHLGFPPWVGILLTQGLVFVALLARDEGVLWFNSLLIPVMMAITLVVSITTIFTSNMSITGYVPSDGYGLTSGNWLWAAILYVSYNMIGGIVVLVTLAAQQPTCRPISGVLGGGFVASLAATSVIALVLTGKAADGYQVPMLFLAHRVSPTMFYLYGAALWAAMLTTAITNAYGICTRLQQNFKAPYLFIVIGVLMGSLPFALVEFAGLIASVYPLFGYLSLVFTVSVIIQGIRLVVRVGPKKCKKL